MHKNFWKLKKISRIVIYFFLDEVGFNVSMRVKKGRTKTGVTPQITIKNIRSKKISVCCAVTKNGVDYFEINDKPLYNSESFLGYLNNFFHFLEIKEIIRAIIIIDNVRFHKTQSVQNFLGNTEHKILFLPPYSRSKYN